MKNFSFTISKKLFFTFSLNILILLMVSGFVIYSFSDLSEQFNYNSELLNYKITLDEIRMEEAKLKGQTQSFYLNATEETIKDGVNKITSSTELIKKNVEKLSSNNNEIINSLKVLSQYRYIFNEKIKNNLKDLNPSIEIIIGKYTEIGFIYDFEIDKLLNENAESFGEHYVSDINSDLLLINQELEDLNKNVKIIATNSINKISTFSNAKKNISNLLKSFDDLKDIRKRIIFKIRSKRGLDPSSVEYMEFEKKITGGSCMENGERGWFTDISETTCIPQTGTGISRLDQEDYDDTGSIRYLNKNLFYNMHLLTTTMDGILSSEPNYNIDQEFNISVDYLCAQPERISIVLRDSAIDMLCGKIVQVNKSELTIIRNYQQYY